MKKIKKTQNNETVSFIKKKSKNSLNLNIFLVPMSIFLSGVLIVVALVVASKSIITRQENLEAKVDKLIANGVSGGQAVTPTETPFDISKLTPYAKQVDVDTNKYKQCLDSKKYENTIQRDITDGNKAGITGTPGFIIGTLGSDGQTVTGVRIKGAYPIENFREVIDGIASGKTNELAAKPDTNDPTGEITGSKLLYPSSTTTISDSPKEGEIKSTRIVIVEFSDYECPYCKRHFGQVYPTLKKEYIDTGKAGFVFRNFIAVSSHNPAATDEASAALCIREQGGDKKYFQIHNLLFQNTQANGLGVKTL